MKLLSCILSYKEYSDFVMGTIDPIGQSTSSLVQNERLRQVLKDMPRTPFIGEESYQEFVNLWTGRRPRSNLMIEESKDTYEQAHIYDYTQGDPDAALWEIVIAQKIFEEFDPDRMEKYRELLRTRVLRTGYIEHIDNKKTASAISVMDMYEEARYFSIIIIRDANNHPEKKEVQLIVNEDFKPNSERQAKFDAIKQKLKPFKDINKLYDLISSEPVRKLMRQALITKDDEILGTIRNFNLLNIKWESNNLGAVEGWVKDNELIKARAQLSKDLQKRDLLENSMNDYEIILPKPKVNSEVFSREVKSLQISPEAVNIPQNAVVTFGDVHANPVYILYLLKITGTIDMVDSVYSKFMEIYNHESNHIFNNLKREDSSGRTYLEIDPVISLGKKNIKDFEENLKNVQFYSGKTLRFLGDEFADQGANDYFNIKLFEALFLNNIDFEAIISNHTLQILHYFENLGKGEKERMRLVEPPTSWLRLLQFIDTPIDKNAPNDINNRVLNAEEVKKLFKQVYLSRLKLLSYEIIDDETIHYFTHAPVPINVIEQIAKRMGVIFKNGTVRELANTIDAINDKFRTHLEKGDACSLWTEEDPNFYDRDSKEWEVKDNGKANYPLASLIWNKNETFKPQLYKHKNYKLVNIHGHTGAPSSNLNLNEKSTYSVGLNSTLGKSKTNQGKIAMFVQDNFPRKQNVIAEELEEKSSLTQSKMNHLKNSINEQLSKSLNLARSLRKNINKEGNDDNFGFEKIEDSLKISIDENKGSNANQEKNPAENPNKEYDEEQENQDLAFQDVKELTEEELEAMENELTTFQLFFDQIDEIVAEIIPEEHFLYKGQDNFNVKLYRYNDSYLAQISCGAFSSFGERAYRNKVQIEVMNALANAPRDLFPLELTYKDINVLGVVGIPGRTSFFKPNHAVYIGKFKGEENLFFQDGRTPFTSLLFIWYSFNKFERIQSIFNDLICGYSSIITLSLVFKAIESGSLKKLSTPHDVFSLIYNNKEVKKLATYLESQEASLTVRQKREVINKFTSTLKTIAINYKKSQNLQEKLPEEKKEIKNPSENLTDKQDSEDIDSVSVPKSENAQKNNEKHLEEKSKLELEPESNSNIDSILEKSVEKLVKEEDLNPKENPNEEQVSFTNENEPAEESYLELSLDFESLKGSLQKSLKGSIGEKSEISLSKSKLKQTLENTMLEEAFQPPNIEPIDKSLADQEDSNHGEASNPKKENISLSDSFKKPLDKSLGEESEEEISFDYSLHEEEGTLSKDIKPELSADKGVEKINKDEGLQSDTKVEEKQAKLDQNLEKQNTAAKAESIESEEERVERDNKNLEMARKSFLSFLQKGLEQNFKALKELVEKTDDDHLSSFYKKLVDNKNAFLNSKPTLSTYSTYMATLKQDINNYKPELKKRGLWDKVKLLVMGVLGILVCLPLAIPALILRLTSKDIFNTKSQAFKSTFFETHNLRLQKLQKLQKDYNTIKDDVNVFLQTFTQEQAVLRLSYPQAFSLDMTDNGNQEDSSLSVKI